MHEWGGGVPQFGGWDDNKVTARTDYSVVFQKARANRKQQLSEINSCNFESDRRFIHQRHKSAQSTLVSYNFYLRFQHFLLLQSYHVVSKGRNFGAKLFLFL